MSPRMIPEVKARIRDLDISEMGEVARRCLELNSATEVESYLGDVLQSVPQTA